MFEAIIHLNLTAMMQTIRHVLPIMRAQGGGAIINVSSLASIAPAGIIAYEVSKAGVNKLPPALRRCTPETASAATPFCRG